MSTVIKKGLTTIFWGGDALFPPSGAIVKSIKYTPVGGKIGAVEDSNGSEVTSVLLNDGFDAAIECEFDSAVTWPAIGDKVVLKSPKLSAGVDCLVVETPGEDVNRKQSAGISFKLEYRPNRTLP